VAAWIKWFEIAFDLAYLVVIWLLVGAMFARRDRLIPQERAVGRFVRWAFLFLAIGDTGHVGFRVWDFAMGGIQARVTIFGEGYLLVGAGAFATAITVTLFYLLLLGAWQRRTGQPYGFMGAFAIVVAGFRLVMLCLPQNGWNEVVAPLGWSYARNALLTIQGLITAWLILRDAEREQDRLFATIGRWILVSFACYLPVILFVHRVPMLGMLMIPKTLAYVAIAVVAYRRLYCR